MPVKKSQPPPDLVVRSTGEREDQMLGLTISREFLLRADEVIE
jgi:hypothetical protein